MRDERFSAHTRESDEPNEKKKQNDGRKTKELQKINKLPLHVCRSRAWSMRHLSFGRSRAPCEPLISPILLQLHWIHSHTQPHTLLLILSTRKKKQIESSKTLTNTNKTPFLCRVVIVPPFFTTHTHKHMQNKQTKKFISFSSSFSFTKEGKTKWTTLLLKTNKTNNYYA